MSASAGGPGWWQASDGLWYPPAGQAAPPPPPPINAPPVFAGAVAAPPPVFAPPPPGSYPQPPGGYPQPPKSSNKGCLIALAVVGGIIIVSIIGFIVVASLAVNKAGDDLKNVGNQQKKAQKDATITKCSIESDQPTALVTVKNNSSKTSSYTITVSFVNSDNSTQLTTGFDNISSLAPGLSQDLTVTGFESSTVQNLSCSVTVTRFSVVG